MFALGSDFTNLQRDLLRKELVGSVVEWDIQFLRNCLRRRDLQGHVPADSIKSRQAVNMLRSNISVYPQDEQDHELLRKAKTNDRMKIRGKVQDVVSGRLF